MKVLRKILCISTLFFALILAVAGGVYGVITKDAVLQAEKLALSDRKIVVYNGNGAETAGGMAATSRVVRIEEIPKKTRLAFIDTEDKRFYSHGGFDVRRIARAAVNNVKSRSFKEGASTISQQLIKNTHLSQEKTLTRKLKEWKLTRALEKAYTKDEILEKYLSVIYFGHNCFGLRSAAAFYFGKTPEELDLADSAILAGLVKSPNNYSPFKNAENCAKRKLCVLNAMLKNGNITQEEKQEAIEKPLPTSPHVDSRNIGYMHFVFDELTALADEYGFPVGGDIQIYTYLDEDLQTQTETLANEYSQSDVTILALDNQTHGFKACFSSVGAIRRLPGSLLKPLLVYAPALEENLLSPATPILDEPIDYGGYSPQNYDGTYHGYVSVRESVAKSLNIPAVKTLNALGTKKCAGYVKKLGLEIADEDLSLALALGGMKSGFSLQQLVSAYSALPCGGTYTAGGFISKIKIDGKTIYERPTTQTRVFSEESAYLTTDMLATAAKTGTAKKLRTLPFPVAAKTGTVGTDKGNTDAYALSYSPRDTLGVWLGNTDYSYIEHTGGGLPCNFLLSLNEYLFKRCQEQNLAISDFKKPTGIAEVALDKTCYYDTHTLTLADELAPLEYRFTEIFKKSCIPTKKSDFFSNPTINSPILRYDDGKVIIVFDKDIPLYSYKIDRYDYATHTTVYEGKFVKEFIDESVEKEKNYVYTVTPIFQNNQGKAIVLPTVTTKAGEPPPLSDREILEKNWWEY